MLFRSKITMMKPRGMGARASQGRLLLHGLLCRPVGTSTGKGTEAMWDGGDQSGRGQGGGGHLTWGCAPGLQQPGPARPPPTARPWRSQSQPLLSHLPGPPAGNGLDQQRTSAHSSSVCLWMRDRPGVRDSQKPPNVRTPPALALASHKLRPLGKLGPESLCLCPRTLDLDDFL